MCHVPINIATCDGCRDLFNVTHLTAAHDVITGDKVRLCPDCFPAMIEAGEVREK